CGLAGGLRRALKAGRRVAVRRALKAGRRVAVRRASKVDGPSGAWWPPRRPTGPAVERLVIRAGRVSTSSCVAVPSGVSRAGLSSGPAPCRRAAYESTGAYLHGRVRELLP